MDNQIDVNLYVSTNNNLPVEHDEGWNKLSANQGRLELASNLANLQDTYRPQRGDTTAGPVALDLQGAVGPTLRGLEQAAGPSNSSVLQNLQGTPRTQQRHTTDDELMRVVNLQGAVGSSLRNLAHLQPQEEMPNEVNLDVKTHPRTIPAEHP